MPRPIALQLYTLREKAKADFPAVLKTVAEIGYVGVEFAGLHNMKAADVKKVLNDVGLVACSAHVPVFDPNKWNEVIDDAKTLGYKHVVGGFGQKDFESEDKIKALADKENAAIEKMNAAGLRVSLHNHWWEYDAPNKGELLLKLCPRLHPQFDIYWVTVGGADPASLIRQYADRTLLLHVKDGPCEKGKPMTAVGKGKVKTKEAIKAAEKASVEWLIVELDSCEGDMEQAVRDSYSFLVGNGLAKGKKQPAS
jgi:sugar phosphate isomerase/epimerase